MKDTDLKGLIERISKSSRLLNDRASEAVRQLEEGAVRAQRVAEQYQRQMASAEQAAHHFVVSLNQAGNRIGPYLQELNRAVEALPQRTKDELEALANNGWYIDPEMPCTASTEFAREFISGDPENAHLRLEGYYDGHANSIENRLVDTFPSRAAILKEAFAAHAQGSYSLSVPVFLAQADGICNEILGVQLYRKTRGGTSTQVREAIDGSQLSPFLEALLAPLLGPFTINEGPSRRANHDLNRHAVLHGESVAYGTFRNSCKAMSLLAFTAWALGHDSLRV